MIISRDYLLDLEYLGDDRLHVRVLLLLQSPRDQLDGLPDHPVPVLLLAHRLLFVVFLQLLLQTRNLFLLLSVPFLQCCHLLPGLREILLGDVVGQFSFQVDSVDVLFVTLSADVLGLFLGDGYLVSFQ